MTIKNSLKLVAFISLLSILTVSCGNSEDEIGTPKPRGYFRIELPKKSYRSFDSTYPYSFQYPSYAVIKPRNDKQAEPYWMNIDFPKFNGEIHISYKPINNNLDKLLDDSKEFAGKHVEKANQINEIILSQPENKVYGIMYEIKGVGTASAYQFIVTDSTKHFIRGALYFNSSPNNDSLSPVLDFIRKDIDHLIGTLKWK